jgi:hypothetical protein
MAMGRPLQLVLESSVLLEPSAGAGAGEPALRPGAEALLRRLRYSNLGVVWVTWFVLYPCGLPLIWDDPAEIGFRLLLLSYVMIDAIAISCLNGLPLWNWLKARSFACSFCLVMRYVSTFQVQFNCFNITSAHDKYYSLMLMQYLED